MSVRILTGDCRDMLATMADASVQCVVTSPPYFGLRAYLPDGHADKAREIGTEQTPDAYVAELVAVFREVRRVLRDDGTVWLNLGDSYAMSTKGAGGQGKQHSNAGSVMQDRSWRIPTGIKAKDLLGIPWMVAFALRADGWWLRSDIIWAKPSCMPESVQDRPTSAHEHVFMLSKRNRYFYDAAAVAEPAVEAEHCARYGGRYEGDNPNRRDAGRSILGGGAPTRNLRNVWIIATRPDGISHFALMPPDLAERCIKAGTSERGQCPHCAAPWARVVEREAPEYFPDSGKSGAMRSVEPGYHRTANGPPGNGLGVKPALTTGWSPTCTCACPEHKPVPQTVLDPFGGAGTTLLVADRLGRNGIGIELNPQYADLARERLRADCPMFAEVA